MTPATKPLSMVELWSILLSGAVALIAAMAGRLRVLSTFGGTTEIQKEIIARSLGLWPDQGFYEARALDS